MKSKSIGAIVRIVKGKWKMNLDTVNKLVPIALMNCPNLISLEIVETSDMTRGE